MIVNPHSSRFTEPRMAIVHDGIPDYNDLSTQENGQSETYEMDDAEEEPESGEIELEVLALPEFGGDDHDEPLFTPPLYIQRYCRVEKLIECYNQPGTDEEFKSLVDIGCAELKFLFRAKNGRLFERLAGLDVDEFLIGSSCRKLQPQMFDMLNVREKPLKVELFVGDATLPDQRLVAVDVVTSIELIEHMELDTHEALVVNVFDVMQPKLAIFTTPNVEYNPLFPGGSIEQRRHWDHRFEWTREEFQKWAKSVTERYPYSVQFSGVGEGPAETSESHGYCSQIATFVRDMNVPRRTRGVVSISHKLVREYVYQWSPPKTVHEELAEIMDAECYTLAKELQDMAESEGRYNQQWFVFPVAELYATRWRLQELVRPPNHLEPIREVLKKKNTEWRIYSPEKDEVSYKLGEPDDETQEYYEVEDGSEKQEEVVAENTDQVIEDIPAWD